MVGSSQPMPIERPAGSTLGLAKQDFWGLGGNDLPIGESFWQKESLLKYNKALKILFSPPYK